MWKSFNKSNTPAQDSCRGDFLKEKKSKKQKKTPDDLTSYFNPAMLKYDGNGSYTGVTADMYYGADDTPVQDADDL